MRRLGKLKSTIAATMMLPIMSGIYAMAAVKDRPYFRAQSLVIVIGGDDFRQNGGVAPVAVDFLLLDNVPSGTAGLDLIGVDGVTSVYSNGGGHRASLNETTIGNSELGIEDQTSGGVFTSAPSHRYLDASDAFTPFGLDGDTDVDFQHQQNTSRFYVASNAAFDIYARADSLATTGDFTALSYDDILYRLILQVQRTTGPLGWGTEAQNPGTGGSGVVSGINDLGDIALADTKVFDGGRKTAATPGSIMEQAVSFLSRYRLKSGEATNRYDFSMGTGTIGAEVTYTIYTP